MTLLAASLLGKTHCCVAGMDSREMWIRPGEENERLRTGPYAGALRLSPNYLWQGTQFIGRSLAIVDAGLDRNIRKSPPHVEDAQLLSAFRYQSQITKVRERANFLQSHSENKLLPNVATLKDLAVGLAKLGRSLVMLGPLTIREASFGFHPTRYGDESYQTRVSFKLPQQTTVLDLACTDLRWRAVGRELGAERDAIDLTGEDLCKHLSVRGNEVYLVIGLTRAKAADEHGALVVGVHTVPDYEAVEVDGEERPIKMRPNKL